MNALKTAIKDTIRSLAPIAWKRYHELKYWRGRKKEEGTLGHDHYQYYFTTHFGFEPSFYIGKTILDIGCGPRGSLEWANMATRRIGVDPLANEYLKLGADQHQMEYINAPSERIPLEDESCDAVFSFNSLDHVESVEDTVKEIKRIVKPGGVFLLLVEANHPPKHCEPHNISPRQMVELMAPEFTYENLEMYLPQDENDGTYQSIEKNIKAAHPLDFKEIGFLSVKFKKK